MTNEEAVEALRQSLAADAAWDSKLRADLEMAIEALRTRIAVLEAENARLSKSPPEAVTLRVVWGEEFERRLGRWLALVGALAAEPVTKTSNSRYVPDKEQLDAVVEAANYAARVMMRRMDTPKTDLGGRLEEVAEALAHQATLATASVDREKWETRKEAVQEARDALEKAAESAP